MSDGTHNDILHRYLAKRRQSASVAALQFVPNPPSSSKYTRFGRCGLIFSMPVQVTSVLQAVSCRPIAPDPARPVEPLGSGVLLRSTSCIPAVV